MTPTRFWILLKKINKRNFQYSYYVICSKKIFISDLKSDIFWFIRNLGPYFYALIPLWIETRNIWSLDLVTAKFRNNVGLDLTTYKIYRNKTLCSVNFDSDWTINKRKFGRSYCIFDSNKLNKTKITGSLIKAESCTVIWSFYPKTAIFASKYPTGP